MRRILASMVLGSALFVAPAHAKGLLDCPMRDAPFSADSPFIDLMLNDKARTALDVAMPGMIKSLPPIMAGTKSPSFGSIMTVQKLAAFGGNNNVDFSKLDVALRAIPVTDVDRVVRCERYDDDRPKFTMPKGKKRVLLFEKMTGFRDGPSVEAANAAFKKLAERNGWALVVTDKGGSMHPAVLKKFDVVVWNNVSGDVLTLTQRKVFQRFVEGGGGFVGVHGSAGDPVYFWDWYPDTLIGARFIGHPSNPQFQDAKVQVEISANGIAKDLAPGWTMNDEWYSFAKSARLNGATVIATLDEKSYAPNSSRFRQSGSGHGRGSPHCLDALRWQRPFILFRHRPPPRNLFGRKSSEDAGTGCGMGGEQKGQGLFVRNR